MTTRQNVSRLTAAAGDEIDAALHAARKHAKACGPDECETRGAEINAAERLATQLLQLLAPWPITTQDPVLTCTHCGATSAAGALMHGDPVLCQNGRACRDRAVARQQA